MTADDYKTALASDDKPTIELAYYVAMRVAWDMRYTARKRSDARQYLPQLTTKLRTILETTGAIAS